MYKNYIFWATEFLNYMTLVFWGLKLFVNKYEIWLNKKERIQNLIIILISLPIALSAVGNYKYFLYSNIVTYTLIIYMYIILKILTRGKAKSCFTLILIYENSMRLIDLWIVVVVSEVSRISRYVELDLIHMGIHRSIFMGVLMTCYYLSYRLLNKSWFLEYLYENRFYRWISGIYSFLGLICFSRVYLFDYNEQLIRYWNFYLICAFILGGIFLFYLMQRRVREREEILNTRNDMMEMNYQGLQKAYEENQVLYHDYKNHMLAVRQLVSENRKEEALAYINTYVELTGKANERVTSGNKILDIIINSKIGEARETGIEFSYEIGYIGNIGMTDIDMCALMANLLDNAIEACERIADGQPWIRLKMLRKKAMVMIQLSNSIHPEDGFSGSFFETRKSNSEIHGLGIKSIEKVLEKYDGHQTHYIRDREFEVFISIPVEEVSEDKKAQLKDRV